MRFVTLSILILASTGAGCATLISGANEDVEITSRTPGARVYVDGRMYLTPCTVTLSRSDCHTVEFPCGRVEIGHSWFGNPWVLLDALWIAGGLLPWIIVYMTDVATGAYRDLEPDVLVYDASRGAVYDGENGEPLPLYYQGRPVR